jgi:hypothetical protein
MERADGAGNGIASLPIFPPHLPPTEPVLANHRSENLRSLHQKRAGGFRACGAPRMQGIDAEVQKLVSDRFDLQSEDAQFFSQVLRKYFKYVSAPHHHPH